MQTYGLFVWLISHQPAVLFSHNKPATSNQPAVLFSQNKPAPAISHQPTEQADSGKKADTNMCFLQTSSGYRFFQKYVARHILLRTGYNTKQTATSNNNVHSDIPNK
jgi:hypothetical protein